MTVLGSGSPFTSRAQAAAGMLVETGDGRVYIMDLGSGAYANLNALELPQAKLDTVFLTHLHCDHWADVTHLYGMSLVYGRTVPLRIWGPSGPTPETGTAAWARAFEQTMAWDIATRRGKVASGDAHRLEVHEFDYREPAWVYDEDGVRVKAFPAIHGWDGPVGYRLEWNGLVFVFSGDTKPNRFFVENAQDADLIVYETFAPPEVHAAKSGIPLAAARKIVYGVHSSPRGAGLVFSLTRPRLAVMYHIRMNEDDVVPILDDVRRTYDGPVAIATDLTVFTIAPGQVTQRNAVTPARPQPVATRPPGGPAAQSDDIAISDWLLAAELRVEGEEYEGRGVF